MIEKRSLFMLALVFMAIASVGVALVVYADISNNDKVIHSSGTGTVIGTPDRAVVTLSVETENFDVKIAQQDNAQRMTNVIDSLVALGLPQDALKTTGYNIYPVYDETVKSIIDKKVRTYRATNTLTITLNDVNRMGDIIDVAVASGINQVNSIQFLLSEKQALGLRNLALKEAVEHARADADTVAGAMGTVVTGVQSADISGGYTPVIYDNYMVGNVMLKSAAPPPLQPGDITVSAHVSITYLIG